MNPALVFLPSALLLAGAAVGWSTEARAGRVAPAAGAWLALLATIALWALTRGSLDVSLGTVGPGAGLAERLDGVTLAGTLALLVPGSVYLTRRRTASPAMAAALAFAVLAAGSEDLLLTAMALAAALAFAMEGGAAALLAPWAAAVMLAWAGVTLQAAGGTANYAATPAGAFGVGPAVLVIAAAALLLGAVPFPSWPRRAWAEGRWSLLLLLPPIGGVLLFRVFEVADGSLPAAWLAPAAAALGVAAAGAAAWRAQAAPDRGAYLAEAVPELGGYALLGAASAVQLGLVALTLTVLATALTVLALPLVTGRRREEGLIAAGLISGFPATLGFGARLLTLQALLESETLLGVALLAAALAWLLWLAASARAAGLPGSGDTREPLSVARAVGALGLLSGILAGALAAYIGGPAAAVARLNPPGPRLDLSVLGVTAASGGWPALALGGVLALVIVAAWVPLHARVQAPREEVPPPLPAPPPKESLRLPAIVLPLSLQRADRALSGANPLLWAGGLILLALVVSR